MNRRIPQRRSTAARWVRVAAATRAHSLTAAALAERRISFDHAAVLARAAHGDRAELFARDEALLVELAEGHDADDFDKLAAAWQLLADEALGKDDPSKRHRDRHVTVNDLLDGYASIDGLLDPETAALFRKACDLLNPPDPSDQPGGPRTLGQRLHDTLDEMSRTALAAHNTKTGTKNPVTVDIRFGVEHLARLRAHDLAEAPPEPEPRDLLALVTHPAVIDGRPTYLAHIARLVCDCDLGRIITNGDTHILDLGRTQRTFTTHQRRALEQLYPTCIGCDRPSHRCEIHHIRHWDAHHGHTNLDNGVPLCKNCHTLLHQGHATITRDTNGTWVYLPP